MLATERTKQIYIQKNKQKQFWEVKALLNIWKLEKDE